MLEELAYFNQEEADEFLRALCNRLVMEAKPVVLHAIQLAKFAPHLVPNLDKIPAGIYFDPRDGFRFTEGIQPAARWLNYNVPEVAFFQTLSDHLVSEIDRLLTLEAKRLF